MKIIVSILLVVVIALVVGCALPSEPKPFPPPEGYSSWDEYHEEYQSQTGSTQPTPAPAAVSEPAIPNHFITYTDEAGLFSISYPQDWELGLSRLEFREQSAKDIIKAIDSDAPVERASAIFLAGLPIGTGSSPNVNIVVESLPGGMWTMDEVAEAFVTSNKNYIPDYYEFSRVKTTIDGREAIIVDYEGTYTGLIKCHYLLMVTLVGKTEWVVTCGALPGEFSKWQDNLNAIVRSLRILK